MSDTYHYNGSNSGDTSNPTASIITPKEESKILICGVCHDFPLEEDPPFTTKTCSHVFCKGCISQLLLFRSSCPTCQTDIQNGVDLAHISGLRLRLWELKRMQILRRRKAPGGGGRKASSSFVVQKSSPPPFTSKQSPLSPKKETRSHLRREYTTSIPSMIISRSSSSISGFTRHDDYDHNHHNNDYEEISFRDRHRHQQIVEELQCKLERAEAVAFQYKEAFERLAWKHWSNLSRNST